MWAMVKFEWNRLWRSRSMHIALIAVSVIIIADFVECMRIFRENNNSERSLYYSWLGVNCEFYTGRYFFMILPILTSLGYSWSACHDRVSGYINQIITRTSRFKYFSAKFIASFISGGIVFAGALILHIMMLATMYPNKEPIPGDLNSFMDPFRFCSTIFYTNTYLFVLIWLLTAFAWGGAMAAICLVTGMILKKPAVTPIVPFIVFTCQEILAAFAQQKYRIMLKGTYLSISWNEMLYADSYSRNPEDFVWGNIAVIIIVAAIIYSLRGKKYECL